jgi:hypothetical protein
MRRNLFGFNFGNKNKPPAASDAGSGGALGGLGNMMGGDLGKMGDMMKMVTDMSKNAERLKSDLENARHVGESADRKVC